MPFVQNARNVFKILSLCRQRTVCMNHYTRHAITLVCWQCHRWSWRTTCVSRNRVWTSTMPSCTCAGATLSPNVLRRWPLCVVQMSANVLQQSVDTRVSLQLHCCRVWSCLAFSQCWVYDVRFFTLQLLAKKQYASLCHHLPKLAVFRSNYWIMWTCNISNSIVVDWSYQPLCMHNTKQFRISCTRR